MKKRMSARALILMSTASAALLSGVPALAQADDPVTVNTVSDEDDTAVQERIIVTGSRIATDSALTAPSPVQTISIDDFRNSGEIEIATSLRNIPALQGSNPASLDSASGVVATGASTLNLRSLGTDRTLVLQDGRRHVAGVEGTATVDIGAIPQSLLARTEVLTGGASAVYGADAVSGVVNFVTRTGRDFDGVEYRLQTGISDEGDSEEVFASIAGGGTFADDRGSAVFALEFNHTTSIVNGDRPNFAGSGFSSLNPSNAFANEILGLDPASEQAFFPNRTLPVSSAGSTIAVDPTPFAFPFGALSSFVTNFNPATDTVPNIAGTNIPVLQVIDPQTGEVRAFNPGISTGAFNAIGGDGIPIGETAPDLTLLPEITRFVAASAIDYDITENIQFFADAKFYFNETSSVAGIPFSDDIPIALDNPFLPVAIQNQIPVLDALLPDSTPSIFVARDNLGSEVNDGATAERTTIRASGGFRGAIPRTGFDYEASFTWGRTDANIIDRSSRLNDRYFAGIDAVALTPEDFAGPDGIVGTDDDTLVTAGSATLNAVRGGQDVVIDAATAQIGDIVCRSELTGLPSPGALFVGGPPLFADGTTINGTDVSGLTRPVTYAIGDGQCAPINILGTNSIQGAGADFAFVDLEEDTTITQQQALITIAGDSSEFFELPAGPIGLALGFEWRKDTSEFIPDSFNSIEGLVVGNATEPEFPTPTNGQDLEVFEGFGEIRIPLLKDLPLVEYLEVTAAGRISDYNIIGGTETFSFAGRYQPHEWLTLRGTFSRAIRSPNIGELFDPQTAAFIGVDDDPCDDGNITQGSANRAANCLQFVAEGFDSADFLTAFVTGTTGGNPNLIEETSDSFTVGGIFQPSGIFNGLLDDLIVVIDYYDFEIEDAVGDLSGEAIASACVDLPSTNNQFCDAVQRNPSNGGAISGFTSGNINLAVLEARGVDFDVRYAFDVPSYGGRDLGSIQASLVGTRFIERSTESDPIIAQTIAGITDPVQQEFEITNQEFVSDLLGTNDNLLAIGSTPELIFTLGLNWELGKWNVGWTGRFEDSVANFTNAALNDVEIIDGVVVVSDNEGLADPSQLFTGNGFEQDINVNYEVSEKFGVYGGIANFTDQEPFLGSLIRPVSPRGRFFFVGVRGTF
ncbi:MAG: TonB-dependent receptor [Pseudomonadota bacterium]